VDNRDRDDRDHFDPHLFTFVRCYIIKQLNATRVKGQICACW